MSKSRIKRVLALILVIFILFVFILTVYFGLKGRPEIALSLLAFNGFFTIVVYFLMRFQNSLNSSVEEVNNNNDLSNDDNSDDDL